MRWSSSTTPRPTARPTVATASSCERRASRRRSAAGLDRQGRTPAPAAPPRSPATSCCSSTPTSVVAPDAIDRLVAALDRHGGLVSVQPHHRVERPYEELSATCNVVALMGSGAFAPWPPPPAVGFGPCLVTSVADYQHVGGHGAVRSDVIEDTALARRYAAAGRPVTAFAGGDAVSFRMYPDGVRQLVDGWTKSLAAGARRVSALAGDRHRLVGDGVPRRSACAASTPSSTPVRSPAETPSSPPPAGSPSPPSCVGCCGASARSRGRRRSSTPCRWAPSSACSGAPCGSPSCAGGSVGAGASSTIGAGGALTCRCCTSTRCPTCSSTSPPGLVIHAGVRLRRAPAAAASPAVRLVAAAAAPLRT